MSASCGMSLLLVMMLYVACPSMYSAWCGVDVMAYSFAPVGGVELGEGYGSSSHSLLVTSVLVVGVVWMFAQ